MQRLPQQVDAVALHRRRHRAPSPTPHPRHPRPSSTTRTGVHTDVTMPTATQRPRLTTPTTEEGPMSELIASPFLSQYLLVRQGSSTGVRISAARYLRLAEAQPH